jgi:hypothetical protein
MSTKAEALKNLIMQMYKVTEKLSRILSFRI